MCYCRAILIALKLVRKLCTIFFSLRSFQWVMNLQTERLKNNDSHHNVEHSPSSFRFDAAHGAITAVDLSLTAPIFSAGAKFLGGTWKGILKVKVSFLTRWGFSSHITFWIGNHLLNHQANARTFLGEGLTKCTFYDELAFSNVKWIQQLKTGLRNQVRDCMNM